MTPAEDIFNGSDDEKESQDTMNQVLDEIGIEIFGNMAKAVSCLKLTIWLYFKGYNLQWRN